MFNFNVKKAREMLENPHEIRLNILHLKTVFSVFTLTVEPNFETSAHKTSPDVVQTYACFRMRSF
jgi:hypothetical protein